MHTNTEPKYGGFSFSVQKHDQQFDFYMIITYKYTHNTIQSWTDFRFLSLLSCIPTMCLLQVRKYNLVSEMAETEISLAVTFKWPGVSENTVNSSLHSWAHKLLFPIFWYSKGPEEDCRYSGTTDNGRCQKMQVLEMTDIYQMQTYSILLLPSFLHNFPVLRFY